MCGRATLFLEIGLVETGRNGLIGRAVFFLLSAISRT